MASERRVAKVKGEGCGMKERSRPMERRGLWHQSEERFDHETHELRGAGRTGSNLIEDSSIIMVRGAL